MTFSRSVFLALLCLAAPAQGFARDFHQCERRCHAEFGALALGEKISGETCACSDSDGHALGKIPRLNPEIQPDMGVGVCGMDGKNYPTAREARRAGVTPLHGGLCGACSNPADIEIYRETRNTLTGTSTRCAVINLLFGVRAGRRCFERVGLSAPCNDCWVENLECTAAHCLKTCLKQRLRRDGNNVAPGELNDCLRCDELHCGEPFIQCAGANRRRSGIHSDIDRPGAQIWRDDTAPPGP